MPFRRQYSLRMHGIMLRGCLLALLMAACEPANLGTQLGPTEITPTVPIKTLEPTVTAFLADRVTAMSPPQQTFEVALVLTNLAIQQTITPEPPPSGPPPTYTPEPFVSGIFPDTYGPLVPTFIPSSHWQGVVNGEQTTVYAGALKSDAVDNPISDQGVVYVVVYSADLSTRQEKQYDAPGSTGLLTVTAESHFRLTLSVAGGVMSYFDIPSRSFVSSLTATVQAQTVTPIPPALPSSTPMPTGGYPIQSATAAASSAPTDSEQFARRSTRVSVR
jgi:hypothetical protein